MDKRIATILTEVFHLREGEVRADLTPEDVQNWDSLTQMDLVLSIERSFAVQLEIEDIVRMRSVAGVILVLKEKGVALED